MKSVASRALGALLLSFVGWVAVSQPTHSQATDVFFVSTPATTPGASDDHSCDAARRVETPRRTIARAMECLTPGAVLYVRGGTYVIPKLLDRGYLALGESKFMFEQREQ